MKYTLHNNIIDTLKITAVVTLVLLMGITFGDAVSEPIQITLGATSGQIREASNMHLLLENIWYFFFVLIAIVLIAFFGLGYLNGRFEREDDYYNF